MIRLGLLIKEKGMMQKDVAKDMNIASSTLNNYVKGLHEPDYATLRKFCEYFGCTADYLLGFSEIREPIMSDEDALLLSAFHRADKRAKDMVLLALEPFSEERESLGQSETERSSA